MPEHDFKKGEELQVRVAHYRRRGSGNTPLMRGQTFKAEQEDLDRSDAWLIFQRPEKVNLEGPPLAEEIDGPAAPVELGGGVVGEEEVELDFHDPDYDQLVKILDSSNLKEAKKFVSRDEWSVEGLEVALEAEEAGRNRTKVKDQIRGHMAQINAGDDLSDDEEPAADGQ